MKKLLLIAGFLVTATFCFAGINGIKSLQGGPGITNGFYLNLGFAFPSIASQSLGFQPNLEFGNQWYFVKNDKMGFGIKVSWLQFGYSTYKPAGYANNTSNLDLRFIKVAPQFTLGLKDDMVLDFTFEISPTAMIGGNAETGKEYAYVASGALFAPGARFRIKKFAVGFGSLSYVTTLKTINKSGGTDNTTVTSKQSVFYPRIYVGFKF